jgi:hypothetical protein
VPPVAAKLNAGPTNNRPFFFAKTTPTTPVTPPPSKPSDTGPVPMEVDASRSRGRIPIVCHRCGQPGHFRNQCPKQYDVRFMTTDELEDCLQNQLTQKDVAATVAVTDIEEEAIVEEPMEEEMERGFPADRE